MRGGHVRGLRDDSASARDWRRDGGDVMGGFLSARGAGNPGRQSDGDTHHL